MDDCDRAAALELQMQKKTMEQLRSANRKKGVSMTECIDCQEPIPKERQKAEPGCTRCVECQSEFEKEGM